MEKLKVLQIEEAALNAWPAVKQMAYDGWLLRFTGGPSKRVNSVNVLNPSTLPLKEKIHTCEAIYEREGLPLIFRLPDPLTPMDLLQALDRKGYRSFDPTLVFGRSILEDVGSLQGRQIRRMDAVDWLEVRAWLMAVSLADLNYHAAVIERVMPEKVLVGVYNEGIPVACGMGVVQGNLLGYFSIYTRLSQRRRGYAHVVITALSRYGLEKGADFGYLQVEGDNLPAQKLYERLGFERLYGYSYRKKG